MSSKRATLAEIVIETGFTHQIRAQCSFNNHPLINDKKYHDKFEKSNYFLHAFLVKFNEAFFKKNEFYAKPSLEFLKQVKDIFDVYEFSEFSSNFFEKILSKVKNFATSIKHKFVRVKVYALVGSAGTGKSFRSHLVADKYSIPLIIDDGVLIKNMKIIAGSSAKFEDNVFRAVKRSVFEDDAHCSEMLEVLGREEFNKILILGTSLKMIDKIISRLLLPNVFKIIYITDVSTRQEIEKARISRQMGEHVVPAAAFEIKSVRPNLLLNPIKVFLKVDGFLLRRKIIFDLL